MFAALRVAVGGNRLAPHATVRGNVADGLLCAGGVRRQLPAGRAPSRPGARPLHSPRSGTETSSTVQAWPWHPLNFGSSAQRALVGQVSRAPGTGATTVKPPPVNIWPGL